MRRYKDWRCEFGNQFIEIYCSPVNAPLTNSISGVHCMWNWFSVMKKCRAVNSLAKSLGKLDNWLNKIEAREKQDNLYWYAMEFAKTMESFQAFCVCREFYNSTNCPNFILINVDSPWKQCMFATPHRIPQRTNYFRKLPIEWLSTIIANYQCASRQCSGIWASGIHRCRCILVCEFADCIYKFMPEGFNLVRVENIFISRYSKTGEDIYFDEIYASIPYRLKPRVNYN